MQCSVVGVNEQRNQSTGLGRSVPAIGAVHQHTCSLQTQRLEKKEEVKLCRCKRVINLSPLLQIWSTRGSAECVLASLNSPVR